MTPLIVLRRVMKEYETPTGPFAALKGIDLTIDVGQLVGIVGRSGAGKSTLLNLLSGIDRPTRGEIYVGQVAVHQLGEDELAVWRGSNVGIVFQAFELLPGLSVLDNVMLPMDFAGRLGNREQRERAMHLLGIVDVAEHAHKLPSAISGGQQQRVAIARALANDPPVVVADEPTGNLDSKTADDVFALFAQLAAGGKTVVLVSHDPDLESRVARTIYLADGCIVDRTRVHSDDLAVAVT
jgi:putative ABC transport system ATP-binding protein